MRKIIVSVNWIYLILIIVTVMIIGGKAHNDGGWNCWVSVEEFKEVTPPAQYEAVSKVMYVMFVPINFFIADRPPAYLDEGGNCDFMPGWSISAYVFMALMWFVSYLGLESIQTIGQKFFAIVNFAIAGGNIVLVVYVWLLILRVAS